MQLGELQELLSRIESRIKEGQKIKQRARQNEARRKQTAEKARLRQATAGQTAVETVDMSVIVSESPSQHRIDYSYTGGEPTLDEVLICQYLPKDKSDTGDPDTPPITTTYSTSARPGTPQKIAVLRQRFEANQELWHPSDATDLDKIVKQAGQVRLL